MPKISAKQRTTTNQQKAKEVVNTKSVKQFSEEELKANEMAQVYEKALGIYKNKPALRYLKGFVRQDTTSFKTWLRAATFAEELEVDYPTYITAQFYYIDKWYSRAPKVHEIASFKSNNNAKHRVMLYVAERTHDRYVVGPVDGRRSESVVVDTGASERNLRDLARNFKKSEEEILRVFGKPGVREIYFDYNWLQSNVIFKKLTELGEL
jgi:hypothetical protein